MNNVYFIVVFTIVVLIASCTQNETKETTSNIAVETSDPLPSWNNGATKTAIIDYVNDVTNTESANFIEIKDRIATFDNDGNLWSEQPAYFQLFFAIDRIKELAPEHPEWKNEQPYKSVLEDNMQELLQQGELGLLKLVVASHTGVTTDEFHTIVKDWISKAKHLTKNIAYNKLVYQPMLELLQYLRANDFRLYCFVC